MKLLKAFFASLVVFLVIDIAWISLFVRAEYDATLGSLMRETPGIGAALIFYLGYIAGIVYFAVRPALADGRARTAIVNGALLGAMAYGTYTLTNHAILSAWTIMLVVSDIAWGAFLTAVTAAAGYFASRP